MTVRAKFTVSRIVTEKYSETYSQNKVFLAPQYDQNIPEDQRFCKATPSGEFWMSIDNPAALGELVPGKAYYIDITAAQ